MLSNAGNASKRITDNEKLLPKNTLLQDNPARPSKWWELAGPCKTHVNAGKYGLQDLASLCKQVFWQEQRKMVLQVLARSTLGKIQQDSLTNTCKIRLA